MRSAVVQRLTAIAALLVLALCPTFGQETTDIVDVEELLDLPIEAAMERLESESVAERVRAGSELSRAALQRGDRSAAIRWGEYSKDTAAEAGDRRLHGEALVSLALVRDAVGDLRAAIRSAREAAAVFADFGDTNEELGALAIQANIEHRLGALADGIETSDLLIDRLSEIESAQLQADVLSNAAMMRFKIGQMDRVPDLLEDASERYAQLSDDDGLGTVFRIWGNYYGAMGEPQRAIMYYERAGAKYDRTGNVFDSANVFFNTALMLMRVEQFSEAAEAFESAVDGFSRAGSASGAGMAATELTVALWELERYGEARATVQRAIGLLRASQSLRRLARAHAVHGATLRAAGNDEAALGELRAARDLYDELGLRPDAAAMETQIDELRQSPSESGI